MNHRIIKLKAGEFGTHGTHLAMCFQHIADFFSELENASHAKILGISNVKKGYS